HQDGGTVQHIIVICPETPRTDGIKAGCAMCPSGVVADLHQDRRVLIPFGNMKILVGLMKALLGSIKGTDTNGRSVCTVYFTVISPLLPVAMRAGHPWSSARAGPCQSYRLI